MGMMERTKSVLQRIIVGLGAKAHMAMHAPPFRMHGSPGKLSDLERQIVHGLNIGIHPLGTVEPFLLAGMSGESLAFSRVFLKPL